MKDYGAGSDGWKGVTLFAAAAYIHYWFYCAQKPKLIFSINNLAENSSSVCERDKESIRQAVRKIISRCKSLHEVYYPSFLFINCHLQLLPFTIKSLFTTFFPPCRWVEQIITLDDGEVIRLDWANSVPGKDKQSSSPILIINHGAFCNTHDLPGQLYVANALNRGWNVCVFNRRGHLRALTKGVFNFFGSTADLRTVIGNHIKPRRPSAPVLLIGVSAGSGLVARYMGEQGRLIRSGSLPDDSFVTGAVGICPGYDIETCMDRIQGVYNNMLLKSARSHVKHEMAAQSDVYDVNSDDSILDMQTWLDKSYLLAGFSCKEEYYEHTNPMRVVTDIIQPSLFINAEDDPFCHVSNVVDNKGVLDVEGNAPGAVIALSKTGSHCSFFELGLTCWTEKVVFEFFEATITASCKV
jgi:predicted alpha/beta-fold hydrolase